MVTIERIIGGDDAVRPVATIAGATKNGVLYASSKSCNVRKGYFTVLTRKTEYTIIEIITAITHIMVARTEGIRLKDAAVLSSAA